jgi:hypothetical protein
MNGINRFGEEQPTNKIRPVPDRDSNTLPSFQSPFYIPPENPQPEIGRISVTTASALQKQLPPPAAPIRDFGQISSRPEKKAEISLNGFINASLKVHKHLHIGVSRLNRLQKNELRKLLREMLAWLENED